MIETKFATEQLDRLSGLSFFPRPVKGDTASQAAFRELRLALECAATDSIGKQVVDDWLRNHAEAPKPAELRAAAYDENKRLEGEEDQKFKPPPARHAHCPQCQDYGIVESIEAGDVRSMACYCDCSAGRGLIANAHGPDERCRPLGRQCPECVNGARRKLIGVQNRNRLKPPKDGEMKPLAEVYSGEF